MRFPVIVGVAALLAGCTDADWAHVMSYTPVPPAEHAEPAASSLPQPTTAPAVTGSTSSLPQPTTTAAAAGSRMGGQTGVSEKAQQECLEWADDRAADATNQNFDEETARKVRDATYSDCMTWAVRLHR